MYTVQQQYLGSSASSFTYGQHNKAFKIYVALDDQSSNSLAASDFFNLFSMEENVLSYTLHFLLWLSAKFWKKMFL